MCWEDPIQSSSLHPRTYITRTLIPIVAAVYDTYLHLWRVRLSVNVMVAATAPDGVVSASCLLAIERFTPTFVPFYLEGQLVMGRRNPFASGAVMRCIRKEYQSSRRPIMTAS